MDVTVVEKAWLLNIILIGSATCLKKERRSSAHKLREGLELQVSCQVTVLHHRPPRDVQIVFLGPEAEESLDGVK